MNEMQLAGLGHHKFTILIGYHDLRNCRIWRMRIVKALFGK
jgi:hypothetical protein